MTETEDASQVQELQDDELDGVTGGLFRVDLSRVMSKYIGETEKNLSQLFDDARANVAAIGSVIS